jgi:hypothetical protein
MREISRDRLVKDARRILENPFWIPDLKSDEYYLRLHDDHDGTYLGCINVSFDKAGDAWIITSKTHNGGSLRFRSFFGGGMSERVRNALMILAFAIKLDNEEKPQKKPQNKKPAK